MKWLEIIELRTAKKINEGLKRSLDELISEVRQEKRFTKIRLYASFSIDGDLSIHLIHNQSKPQTDGSILGLRITDALKTFGMVNHQVWRAIENDKKYK